MICECGHVQDEHDDVGCLVVIDTDVEFPDGWTCGCEIFDWNGEENKNGN